jgi:hypothetical protein
MKGKKNLTIGTMKKSNKFAYHFFTIKFNNFGSVLFLTAIGRIKLKLINEILKNESKLTKFLTK